MLELNDLRAIMNETVIIKVPKNNDKLYLRSEHEAETGGKNSNASGMQHSVSIKVKTKKNAKGFPIPISTKSYADGITSSKQDIDDSLKKAGVSKSFIRFAKSFIYDNQMALCAYWYTKDVPFTVFDAYFKAKTSEVDYSSTKIDPKTTDELNADKIEIINYLRNATKNPDLIVDFGK